MSARIAVVVAGVFLAAGSAAAQWEVDATGSNASPGRARWGLMYVCASNAPSRGRLSTGLQVPRIRDMLIFGAVRRWLS